MIWTIAITFMQHSLKDHKNKVQQGCPIRRCHWNLDGIEAPLQCPFKCWNYKPWIWTFPHKQFLYPSTGYRSMIPSIDIYSIYTCWNIKPCTYCSLYLFNDIPFFNIDAVQETTSANKFVKISLSPFVQGEAFSGEPVGSEEAAWNSANAAACEDFKVLTSSNISFDFGSGLLGFWSASTWAGLSNIFLQI